MCFTSTSAPAGPAEIGTKIVHGLAQAVLSTTKPGSLTGRSIQISARRSLAVPNSSIGVRVANAVTVLPRGIGDGKANDRVIFFPVPKGRVTAGALAVI